MGAAKNFKKPTLLELNLFTMRVLECDRDLNSVRDRYYKEIPLAELEYWYEEVEKEVIISVTYLLEIMKYPNSQYQFSKYKLMSMKSFLRLIEKYRCCTNPEMLKFFERLKSIPMADLEPKINRILADMENE